MKRGMVLFALVIMSMSFALAVENTCDLEVTLLNQDPYPAVPGDYVDLVFQVSGLASPGCGEVTFELLEKYPIMFDPGVQAKKTINAGTFTKDYSNVAMIPYTVRLDSHALDGNNTIEVKYDTSKTYAGSFQSDQFDLEVDNVLADFDVIIEDYVESTRTLSLEVLNIAEDDVEALTIEILPQENILVKGQNKKILGDLDSQEYSTIDFEATPEEGEITLQITYTDAIKERRTIEKKITFEPEYFKDRANSESSTSVWTWIFWIVVVVGLCWWYLKKRKSKHKKRN
jgi:hypothetical protein